MGFKSDRVEPERLVKLDLNDDFGQNSRGATPIFRRLWVQNPIRSTLHLRIHIDPRIKVQPSE